jgi:hypothetical protein
MELSTQKAIVDEFRRIQTSTQSFIVQEGEVDIDLVPLFTVEPHTPLNSTAQPSTYPHNSCIGLTIHDSMLQKHPMPLKL